MRSLLIQFAVTVVVYSLAVGQEGKQRSRLGARRIHAPAYSLERITRDANRILQGKILSVAHESLDRNTADGKAVAIPVNVVEIAVERFLKGAPIGEDTPKRVKLRFYAKLAPNLKADTEVLMYLAKESRLGLTAPIGVYSGLFRVATDSGGGKVVVNLKGNEGLWGKSSPLFPASSPSYRKFMSTLEGEFSDPRDASRNEQIRKVAAKGNPSMPIPLELVTSATKTILSEAK